MKLIEHFNFGWLHKPPLPAACCHCLLIQTESSVVLIDTGIGMRDIEDTDRIGRDAIDAAGFQFLPEVTAIHQLESRGISRREVTDIVLTHCDSDHVGGLSDFPDAQIHVSLEEKMNLDRGNLRYTPKQFSHRPNWRTYGIDDCETLGLPSRRIQAAGNVEIRLVPLFGHTSGHCGVAVHDERSWILHVGDAYYLRDELTIEHHPISELASQRADSDELRRRSLVTLRKLTSKHREDLTFFGYHDTRELPTDIPRLNE